MNLENLGNWNLESEKVSIHSLVTSSTTSEM
jgi:hypothetical protein